jgi:hemoglobin
MTATMTTTNVSLFAQLGGRDSVAAVVDEFYRRVLADDNLGAFFAGLDMERQRRHLATFIGFALGGPNEYQGRSLRRAHAGLGISQPQFGAVAGHLHGALAAFAVPEATIAAVLGAVAALEGDVVGH